MKFKYAKYNGQVLRPVVPIKVKNKNLEIGYQVLVDSGADFCLFHAEIGEAIGLDIKKGKKGIVTGVGGKSSEYFLHKVTLEVGGWPYEIEAGFLPEIGTRSIPYGLVGQIGFFEHFKVIFDRQSEEIELKPKDK
jgi:hypothetical protein